MCYWIWDKGNPREAHGIARVRELTMMWDRANSNWVKHILPGLTYNSSLVRTFCFYPQPLHHATDLPLFNWMCEAWLSPAIPCSSFPKHEDGNHPISTEQSQAEHQPTKNCCANRNVEVVEGCAEPAFYSPSYHSWSHLLVKPHNGSPPKHLVSSSAWISVKKQTDKNATANNSPALVPPLAESFQLTKV